MFLLVLTYNQMCSSRVLCQPSLSLCVLLRHSRSSAYCDSLNVMQFYSNKTLFNTNLDESRGCIVCVCVCVSARVHVRAVVCTCVVGRCARECV